MSETVSLPADLARRLSDKALEFGVPGLAVALVDGDRRAVFMCGVDEAGSGRAVGQGTWFSVASLGKHLTAAAVLELAQEGRVDLEAPVEQYLADLPDLWRGRSVLSLMRHTSGLPEYLSYSPADAVPEARDAFMRQYGNLAPAFNPGEAWIYTNTNYILLGLLVAQVAQRPYADAVQDLFTRAGCRGAAVASPHWTREANRQGLGAQARDEGSARRQVIGDGDVSFTVHGALAWLEALLRGDVLQPRYLQTMFSPAPLQSGRPSPYGCGWFLDQLRGEPLGHHGGHYDGWTAMACLLPTQRRGVIALCNLAPGNTRAVRYLAQMALEGFAPGSTPLSLDLLEDDDAALSATIRAQMFRRGDTLDRTCFAEELLLVAAHGSAVRPVMNLWTGVEPLGFDLVERQTMPTHQLRRYRVTYAERVEHLLVGVTPDRRIFWAWPM